MRIMSGVLASVMLSSVASLAWPKGATVALTVRGDGLAAPLEITDPSILGLFSIWTGPGVRVNGEQTHLDPENQTGAFIDWPQGRPAARPPGLARFEVTFSIDRRIRDTYTILYELDPATPGGYIYLPSAADASGRNQSLIVHGIEGYWFRSSGAWEHHVRPIIDSSMTPIAAEIETRNQLLATGDFVAAEARLRAALERDPANTRARGLLAYSLLNQLRTDEAGAQLDELVEREYGFLGELGYQSTRYGSNRAAAAQAVLAIGDSQARAQVLASAADGWAEADAPAAQAWLLDLPIGALRDRALAGFARGLASTGAAVAPSVMQAFSSDAAREVYLQHVATRLAMHSPDRACRLLPVYVTDPPRREQLLAMVGACATTSP